MVKNKKEKIDIDKEALWKQTSKLRLVVMRGEDRRQDVEQSESIVLDQRIGPRRQDDVEKKREEIELLRQENERLQERQRMLMVSRPELILYYAALVLSVNVIFGWMAYLALFLG